MNLTPFLSPTAATTAGPRSNGSKIDLGCTIYHLGYFITLHLHFITHEIECYLGRDQTKYLVWSSLSNPDWNYKFCR